MINFRSMATQNHILVLTPGLVAPAPLAISAGAGESIDIRLLVFPEVSADVDIKVDLTGEEASLNISGFYLCGADENVAIRTEVNHKVPRCRSNQIINGVAGGKAKASFYGKIVVAPDAVGTEAFQTNRNLLLSESAVIDTKPQLEIYADDVQCSHGATVGKLDELELFYMRSRGVPLKEARIMQIYSFLSPALAGMEEADKYSALLEEVLRKI